MDHGTKGGATQVLELPGHSAIPKHHLWLIMTVVL